MLLEKIRAFDTGILVPSFLILYSLVLVLKLLQPLSISGKPYMGITRFLDSDLRAPQRNVFSSLTARYLSAPFAALLNLSQACLNHSLPLLINPGR